MDAPLKKRKLTFESELDDGGPRLCDWALPACCQRALCAFSHA